MTKEIILDELIPYLEETVVQYQHEIDACGDDNDLARQTDAYCRGCRDMADHILAYVQGKGEANKGEANKRVVSYGSIQEGAILCPACYRKAVASNPDYELQENDAADLLTFNKENQCAATCDDCLVQLGGEERS